MVISKNVLHNYEGPLLLITIPLTAL